MEIRVVQVYFILRADILSFSNLPATLDHSIQNEDHIFREPNCASPNG